VEKNARKGSLVMEPTERWTPQDASELYDVASWGKGYFSVDASGHLCVHPAKDPQRSIDLKQLVDTLVLRGISLPVLVRFAGILEHRLGELHGAFQTAIAEHRYQGEYCCVYPIKVNQQRQVVEEVLEFGRPFKFGLEAGSKPELMAVMAMAGQRNAHHLQRLQGRRIHRDGHAGPEAGPPHHSGGREIHRAEADSALLRAGGRAAHDRAARQAGQPRLRPLALSGGYRSKFGLSVSEALRALQELKDAGMADCLNLLHFHLGSQITNIRQIKAAVNEAVRVYVDLARAGAGLRYLDVGGGLGIDYDGSQTDFESSVNYTLQEYANDVVYHIQSVCDEVPACRIRPSSPRAGGPSPLITACWCSTCWASRAWANPTCRRRFRPTPNSRSSTCRKPIAR
jgi:arginine decarboxylase